METTAAEPDPALATDEAPQEAIVRSSGLFLRLDDRPILSDISLSVPPGRTMALLGANGAGKSTLLHVLATLLAPTRGRLELFGQVGAARARSRIGLITHQPVLYRDLTARENLLFFGRLYGITDPQERASRMLRLVGMGHRADDAVKTLSRGMTQRVSIARALMHDPDLLLADE
ncbi:MAG: ATP-binding cassette domain-containing protein, partial [Planctomycetota bacterium]